MQTVTKLRRIFGLELSMVELFETPTVAALATHLEELGLSADQAGVAAPTPTAAPAAAPVAPTPAAVPVQGSPDDDASLVDRIQAMSDDEVRALLAQYEGREG